MLLSCFPLRTSRAGVFLVTLPTGLTTHGARVRRAVGTKAWGRLEGGLPPETSALRRVGRCGAFWLHRWSPGIW